MKPVPPSILRPGDIIDRGFGRSVILREVVSVESATFAGPAGLNAIPVTRVTHRRPGTDSVAVASFAAGATVKFVSSKQ